MICIAYRVRDISRSRDFRRHRFHGVLGRLGEAHVNSGLLTESLAPELRPLDF